MDAVCDTVSVEDSVCVGELVGLECVAVAERVAVMLPVGVATEDGVLDGVCVPVLVGDGVTDGVGVMDGVVDAVAVPLTVRDPLSVAVMEEVPVFWMGRREKTREKTQTCIVAQKRGVVAGENGRFRGNGEGSVGGIWPW